MTWLAHRRSRAAIDRAFVGPVAARRWAGAREHIAGCAACREYHDRLAAVSAALSDSALPELAAGRIEEQILGEHRPRPRRHWWIPAAATAVAAAAALLVMWRAAPTSELQPRGEQTAGLIPGERAPGVRIFCVSPDGVDGHVIDEARAEIPEIETPTMRCILGGELQIAYSTPSLRGMTMIAYSRDPSGQLHQYAPRSSGDLAVPLVADAIDEPLGWSTRLAVGHQPGDHELVIRFFDRPVAAAVGRSDLASPIYELRAHFSIAGEAP